MAMVPVNQRDRRLVGLGAVLWVFLWLVLGLLTAVQVRRLAAVSDTIVDSGRALDTAGRALEQLGGLPVVGQTTSRLADRVRVAASDIEDEGRASREAIGRLSVLLGVSLVLVPVTSVLVARVPDRLALRRDRRGVAEALARDDGSGGLEEYLARRAVHHLPYDVLTQVTAEPWKDLRTGAFRRLANAELTRLGLAGPRARSRGRHGARTRSV
ncbi:MAG TPA: hypothetical protein VG455_10955 [Acidimicrobiales bacterium]|nr:hypothetical protein [Acidimicrobiales bacterium]